MLYSIYKIIIIIKIKKKFGTLMYTTLLLIAQ